MQEQQSHIESRADVLEWLETPDGFVLRVGVFRATQRPYKGSVLLLHGRNEALEKYDHVIDALNGRGFDVVSFDWRGQGRSTRFFKNGIRGYVDDFEQYAQDLELVFSKVALPEARPPFFLLAHSMGGLIALYAAPRLINRLQRMVLASPFIALGDDTLTSGQMHALSSSLCFVGLGNIYLAGGDKGSINTKYTTNKLTTDLDQFEHNRALMAPDRGLGIGGPTAAWLRACTAAMATIADPEHYARIHIPTLIIGSGADTIVSNNAIEDYANRLRSGALIMIDGAKHELMQESQFYRAQFYAAFDAFVPGSQ
jgi:lysophospholipase